MCLTVFSTINYYVFTDKKHEYRSYILFTYSFSLRQINKSL